MLVCGKLLQYSLQ